MSDLFPSKMKAPKKRSLPEITLKAFSLSIVLAIILAAANGYLALKVGMTISGSIPAAVAAMAILRLFKQYNVLEINIVQTSASAGEAIAAASVFTIPAFLILGDWNHFNYRETVVIIGTGGILGVLFSVPLRRTLLHKLRFPEGTAIGKVLQSTVQNATSSFNLIMGGLAGSVIFLCQSGFGLVAESVQCWTVRGGVLFGFSLGFSPALLGAGYIVGGLVAFSIFVGAIMGWGICMPVVSCFYPNVQNVGALEYLNQLWSDQIRYIGVGVILVAGFFTLFSLTKPLLISCKESIASIWKFKEEDASTDKDMPFSFVVGGILLLSVVVYFLLLSYFGSTLLPLSFPCWFFALSLCFLYTLIAAFIFSSICGYLVGIVGSSSSPISSMTIASLLLVSLLLLALLGSVMPVAGEKAMLAVAAFAIVMASVITASASIANDTLQDLKAGHMVGATPWKQQLMLVVGVIASALVIPLILQLLYDAYGMGGIFPRKDMDSADMLSAPQATLIATIAKGIFTGHIPWPMVIGGASIGLVGVIFEFLLQKIKKIHFPILGIGIGIYLPLTSTTPLIMGGFLAWGIDRYIRRRFHSEPTKTSQQGGLLLACGLVAGASLMGVILAVPYVLMESADCLRLVSQGFTPYGVSFGVLSVLGIFYWFYQVVFSSHAKSHKK